jgi:hypothetical protein
MFESGEEEMGKNPSLSEDTRSWNGQVWRILASGAVPK